MKYALNKIFKQFFFIIESLSLLSLHSLKSSRFSRKITYLSQRSWWYAGAIYLLNSLKRSLNCDNAFLTLKFQLVDGRWYEYPNPGPSIIFRKSFPAFSCILTSQLCNISFISQPKNTTYHLLLIYYIQIFNIFYILYVLANSNSFFASEY